MTADVHRWSQAALLAGLLAACAVGAGYAQQPVPVARHVEDTWLEGSVAGAAVRVFFGPAGWPLEEGTLWGAYFYTREWALIPLEGHREPSGAIVLYEGDPGTAKDQRARFELNLTQGPIVSGTWATADRSRTARVRLRTIPQPPPYEKAIARPRTFDDPQWPFTFTYPNGWSLKVSASTFLLQSADPFDMLFDNRLECERGEGLPPRPAAGAPPTEFHGAFYLGHDGWVAASEHSVTPFCDEPNSECTTPTTRSSGDAVFMGVATSYRSYNPWGYAGMADAANYLVVDGNRWAFCVDRALDSPDRIVLRASKRR